MLEWPRRLIESYSLIKERGCSIKIYSRGKRTKLSGAGYPRMVGERALVVDTLINIHEYGLVSCFSIFLLDFLFISQFLSFSIPTQYIRLATFHVIPQVRI